MKKLAFIGVGYVGLVTGACFAELGNEVIGVGRDQEKIDNLNKGIEPFYEPGLREVLHRNLKEKRLRFTTDLADAVENSDIIFIAVGTPQAETGEADLSQVAKVATDVSQLMKSYKIIVNKSTVPVGTGDMVKNIIKEKYSGEYDVVSCPEFLREGSAVGDCLKPDRVVVGVASERAQKEMAELFSVYDCPVLTTNVPTAEITKYAANSLLATEISFINMVSRLCEKTGANIKQVSEGLRLDKRIGPHAFVNAGIGYGGACFPKDVSALIATLKAKGLDASILEMVQKVNADQKASVMPKVKQLLPELKDKTVALWGLSFKPNTDDMREAPSLVIIDELIKEGAKIRAHDPIAMEVAKKMIGDKVTLTETMYEALEGADLLVIVTDCDEFKQPDLVKMKGLMKQAMIVDGRNVYEPAEVEKQGFKYIGLGRGDAKN